MTMANIGGREKRCQDFCAQREGLAHKTNVVSHVGAVSSIVHIRCVRPTLKRILVAATTIVLGLLLAAVHRPARQQSPPPPAPAVASNATQAAEPTEATYSDGLPADPFSIASFLRAHPTAKLGALWRRLGIPSDNPYYSDDACSYCEPSTFTYDLDSDAPLEVVLEIREPVAESVKYLVFDDSINGGSKLIGHTELWTKYESSDPIVFASNGRNWLIVQGTAATGSGLGAWSDTIYEVWNGRLKPMATYLARVRQNGYFNFPTKEFVASPVAAEVKEGKFVLTLSYAVEYSGAGPSGELPLFTKQQQVLLVNSLKHQTYYVDEARSEIAPVEFESIYNYDTMKAIDFVSYNRFELWAIANGTDAEKKSWLKEFLETCPNYPIKRELLAILRYRQAPN
jgi:hypothetical protein